MMNSGLGHDHFVLKAFNLVVYEVPLRVSHVSLAQPDIFFSGFFY